MLKSISADQGIEVTVYFVARTLSKRLTFLIVPVLLGALAGLVLFVVVLTWELLVVVAAVVGAAVINHFLTAFAIVPFVFLELLRRSKFTVVLHFKLFKQISIRCR